MKLDGSTEATPWPEPPDGVSTELLVEAVKRAELLASLRDGPETAGDLVADLDASRSTVHRATQSFVEKEILRETDDGLALTGLGRVVADEVASFGTRVLAADRLGEFLNTADTDDVDVPIGQFVDATVIHPKPRQPHFAVKRIIELIEASSSVKILSSIVSPFYVDVAYREMMDGTEIEVVFDQQVVEIVAAEYADRAREAARTGHFEVLVHDAIPFELFVFDDCMGMAAHDDNGIARVFVETDGDGAVSWAEDVYGAYREQGTAVDLSAF